MKTFNLWRTTILLGLVALAAPVAAFSGASTASVTAFDGQCLREVDDDFCCDCTEPKVGTCDHVVSGYWACGATWCPNPDTSTTCGPPD
jgi:hypothetical protein